MKNVTLILFVLLGLSSSVAYGQDPGPIGSCPDCLGRVSNPPGGTTGTVKPGEPTSTTKSIADVNSYPNPFNPSTTIRFNLKQGNLVQVRIFNMSGQVVATLLSANLAQGVHEVRWDAAVQANGMLPSGVYFLHIQAGNEQYIHRMTLLK